MSFSQLNAERDNTSRDSHSYIFFNDLKKVTLNIILKIYSKVESTPCETIEGLRGKCQPPAYCFSQYNNIDDYVSNICKLNNGDKGICCPEETRNPIIKNRKFGIFFFNSN